jgi:hypothetical protein
MGVTSSDATDRRVDFGHRCAKAGLSEAGRAKTWARLDTLSVGPNTLEANELIMTTLREEQADRLEGLVAGLALHIETIAKSSTESLRTSRCAVKEALQGFNSTLDAKLDHADAIIKQQANTASAVVASAVVSKISEEVNKAVIQAAEQRGRNSRNTWAAATFAIAAGCSAAAAGGAWYAGSRAVQSNVTQIQTMLTREGGAAWSQVMAGNDMSLTLATYCGPGSPNIRRVDGGTACTVPLWLHRDGVVGLVPGRTAEMAAGMSEVRDALQTALGTWGLLAAGAASMLGLLALVRVRVVRRLFGSKADASFGG